MPRMMSPALSILGLAFAKDIDNAHVKIAAARVHHPAKSNNVAAVHVPKAMFSNIGSSCQESSRRWPSENVFSSDHAWNGTIKPKPAMPDKTQALATNAARRTSRCFFRVRFQNSRSENSMAKAAMPRGTIQQL